MQKTSYIIEITGRDGGKVTETYQSAELQETRLKELTGGNMTNTEIHEIKCSEFEIDDTAQSFVKDIAVIASLITGEFYRTFMLRSLLSAYEISVLIANVSITCFVAFERFPVEKGASVSLYREKVLEWAKNHIFEKHNIKL